jgi:predicted transcriptional regulator
MTTMSVRIPDSIHRKVRELASQERISINQFINSALAEKLAALLTEDYLARRAERGSREKLEAALAKVPDVAPTEGDEIE